MRHIRNRNVIFVILPFLVTALLGCDGGFLSDYQDDYYLMNRNAHIEVSLVEGASVSTMQSGDVIALDPLYAKSTRSLSLEIANPSGTDLHLTSPDLVDLDSPVRCSLGTPYPSTPILAGNVANFSIIVEPEDPGEFEIDVKIPSSNGEEGLFPFTLVFQVLENPTPGIPVNLAASDGMSSEGICLSWDGVPNADDYALYRSGGDTEPTDAKSLTAIVSSLDYFDEDVVPGQSYRYWVKVYDGTYSSPFSESDTGFRGLEAPVFSAGTGASDGIWDDRIELDWDDIPGTDIEYRVYRNTSATVSNAMEFPSIGAF